MSDRSNDRNSDRPVDREWLKNLAEARYEGGRWQTNDPQAVERLAAARVNDAVMTLFDAAQDAAEVYNEYARGARQLRVLPLTLRPDAPPGFMLLMGRLQINVTYEAKLLVATLIRSSGFERRPERLARFLPHVDAFGSVVWSSDNALLMTSEMIIKKLFEEISRATFPATGGG